MFDRNQPPPPPNSSPTSTPVSVYVPKGQRTRNLKKELAEFGNGRDSERTKFLLQGEAFPNMVRLHDSLFDKKLAKKLVRSGRGLFHSGP